MSTGAILGFCPIFQFVKQVHFILLHYGWKYFQAFACPYNLSPTNFGSFHVANIFVDFSKVSGQIWCLWNKYQFGKSIWYDLFAASTYDQIMKICQVIAHLTLLVSASSSFDFWVRFGICIATMLNHCPNDFIIPRTVVLSTLSLPDNKFTFYPLWFTL